MLLFVSRLMSTAGLVLILGGVPTVVLVGLGFEAGNLLGRLILLFMVLLLGGALLWLAWYFKKNGLARRRLLQAYLEAERERKAALAMDERAWHPELPGRRGLPAEGEPHANPLPPPGNGEE